MADQASDSPILDLLATMNRAGIEASKLDPQSLMLVRIAASLAVWLFLAWTVGRVVWAFHRRLALEADGGPGTSERVVPPDARFVPPRSHLREVVPTPGAAAPMMARRRHFQTESG